MSGIPLQIECILPSQFASPEKPPPELLLMAAMLESAIDDLRIGRFVRRDHQRRPGAKVIPSRWTLHCSPRESALEWIISNDRTWPFSFVNICDTLGLEPELVRAQLLRRSA